MTISKWVNLIYTSIAFLAYVVFSKALQLLFTNVDQLTDTSLIGRYVTVTTLIAAGLSIALTAWMYRKSEIYAYISEVVVELRKVQWPTMDETRRSTLVVIVFTILLSSFLAFFDQVWKYLTDLLITGGV